MYQGHFDDRGLWEPGEKAQFTYCSDWHYCFGDTILHIIVRNCLGGRFVKSLQWHTDPHISESSRKEANDSIKALIGLIAAHGGGNDSTNKKQKKKADATLRNAMGLTPRQLREFNKPLYKMSACQSSPEEMPPPEEWFSAFGGGGGGEEGEEESKG